MKQSDVKKWRSVRRSAERLLSKHGADPLARRIAERTLAIVAKLLPDDPAVTAPKNAEEQTHNNER